MLPLVDDGVACTDDSCDEQNDVVWNAPNAGLCDDGDACTADGCDGVSGCFNDPILNCRTADVPALTHYWQAVLIASLLAAAACKVSVRIRSRRS